MFPQSAAKTTGKKCRQRCNSSGFIKFTKLLLALQVL